MIDIDYLNTRTSISNEGKEQLVTLMANASLVGASTVEYMKSIIETGRMERRIIDGCKAILSLKIAYSFERLEAACNRGLTGNKFNYGAILNILQNKQDLVAQMPVISQVPPDRYSLSGGANENTEASESLRGAIFFNLENNDIDE